MKGREQNWVESSVLVKGVNKIELNQVSLDVLLKQSIAKQLKLNVKKFSLKNLLRWRTDMIL